MKNSEIEKISLFLENANLIGNLPEVPEPKEVPYISFYHEPFYENDLKNLCFSFGEVFRIAPIQIKSLTPKPGAILIEWQQSHENSEDKIKDIQKFRLQRAYGDVLKDKNLAANFIDCYTGLDSQFLLRDIQILQLYSFRICCKFDGSSEWSPWSVPQVGSTTIRWFSWEQSDGAILSNDNKILKLNNAEKIVFSDSPPVSLDDSVEFTILEVDNKCDMYLALMTNPNRDLNKLKDCQSGIILVDSNGRIFVDGTEKSTVLPKFTKGLKVCYSLEKLSKTKVRVNLDSSDKRVTYDWSVGDSAHLFFACQMMSTQWKVMVE